MVIKSTTPQKEKLTCRGIGFKEMPYSVAQVARIAMDISVNILTKVQNFKEGKAPEPDGISKVIFEDDFAFHILPKPTEVTVNRNRVKCRFLTKDKFGDLRCKTGIPFKDKRPPCIIGVDFKNHGIDPQRWEKDKDNWFITSPQRI